MSMNEAKEPPISVHMVGGDYLVGLALRQLLSNSGFIRVVGMSVDFSEAVEQIRRERPDILLIDAAVGVSGIASGIRALKAIVASPKVIVLSAQPGGDSAAVIQDYFAAGATGYLMRNLALEDVAAALRIVFRGGLVNAVLPSCAHLAHVDVRSINSGVSDRLNQLSSRDKLIVAGVVDGRTNTEIARRMNLSEATVKARLAQVMQALGLQNRVQVAVAAVQSGL